MSSVDALRERTEAFLKQPSNNLPVAAPAAAGLESMGAPTAKEFSVFIPKKERSAWDRTPILLWSTFSEL